MKKNTKKGFTLVELLVVIAILAILASVAVVGYTAFIKKANDAKISTEVDQVKDAINYAFMNPDVDYVKINSTCYAIRTSTGLIFASTYPADKTEMDISGDIPTGITFVITDNNLMYDADTDVKILDGEACTDSHAAGATCTICGKVTAE
ncbi:MAG: type II secretion system protein [Clostridia bacterium]|nr:type II secretion system protein [Clostridia bacterium]